MANNSMAPIAAIVVVAAILIGIAYANITGMVALSGAKVVDKNTATVIVAILFIATLPWVYKQAKSS